MACGYPQARLILRRNQGYQVERPGLDFVTEIARFSDECLKFRFPTPSFDFLGIVPRPERKETLCVFRISKEVSCPCSDLAPNRPLSEGFAGGDEFIFLTSLDKPVTRSK